MWSRFDKCRDYVSPNRQQELAADLEHISTIASSIGSLDIPSQVICNYFHNTWGKTCMILWYILSI